MGLLCVCVYCKCMFFEIEFWLEFGLLCVII
jgi:hypothetical protein